MVMHLHVRATDIFCCCHNKDKNGRYPLDNKRESDIANVGGALIHASDLMNLTCN